MAAKGITVMIVALGILVIPGVFVNNLNASGLTLPDPNLVCNNADSPLYGCQGSVPVGCQTLPGQCNLQNATAFQFLNQASPFTQLLTGNIFGFFKALTNGGQTTNYGPFDLVGGGRYVTANCVVHGNGGKVGLISYVFSTCTESTTPDNANMTLVQAESWDNWNPNLAGRTVALPFFQLVQNATHYFQCSFQANLNYTTGGVTTGYTWYGCDYGQNPFVTGALTHPAWSFLIEVPFTIGLLTDHAGYSCTFGTCYHLSFPVQLESWETHQCNTGAGGNPDPESFTYSQQCQKWFDSLHSQVQTASSNSQSFGLLTPILTFMLGLILLFIGLGIQIAGGGSVLGSGVQGSAGTNVQGTRLAQVLGIGLLIWTPLYSEFNVWITPGNLPNGSDVVVTVLLIAAFFIGIVWTTWGSITA